MRTVLVSGGTLEEAFTLDYLRSIAYDKLIGIDKGVEFLYAHGMIPDLMVGDFDSLPEGVLKHFEGRVPIRKFQPEKDATDTEIGIRAALEMGAKELIVLGATGSRMDHVLGNIQTLMLPLGQGVEAYLLDAHNRIRLLSHGRRLCKEHMFGTYISFIPLTTRVEGLTLRGFKYPLSHAVMTSDNSLGVSNEMIADEAHVSFDDGVLIMIESRD